VLPLLLLPNLENNETKSPTIARHFADFFTFGIFLHHRKLEFTTIQPGLSIPGDQQKDRINLFSQTNPPIRTRFEQGVTKYLPRPDYPARTWWIPFDTTLPQNPTLDVSQWYFFSVTRFHSNSIACCFSSFFCHLFKPQTARISEPQTKHALRSSEPKHHYLSPFIQDSTTPYPTPVSKPLLCRTVYPAPCICTYLPSVCILQPARPLQPHQPSCKFLQLPERRAVRTRHSARPKRRRTEYSTLVNTSRSFWDCLAPAPTKSPVFHPPGKQLQPVCPSPQQHVILRLALFLDVLDVSRLSWKSPRLWRRMSASPLPLPRPTSRRRVTR
ncbi:hypothetical protein CABS01_04831, partial [Colletotrichum abscissum]|uniref:uncharacterized protein n=1 Tax=Colletotrichum abscissum TaxID=1671311 RepID=UPI0027D5D361